MQNCGTPKKHGEIHPQFHKFFASTGNNTEKFDMVPAEHLFGLHSDDTALFALTSHLASNWMLIGVLWIFCCCEHQKSSSAANHARLFLWWSFCIWHFDVVQLSHCIWHTFSFSVWMKHFPCTYCGSCIGKAFSLALHHCHSPWFLVLSKHSLVKCFTRLLWVNLIFPATVGDCKVEISRKHLDALVQFALSL